MQITINIPEMSKEEFLEIEQEYLSNGWPSAEDVFSDAIRECLNVGALRKKWQYRDYRDNERCKIETQISHNNHT